MTVGSAAAVLLAAGCCLSAQQARTRGDQLRAQNLARALPAMEAAAKAQGARLLPAEAQATSLPPECEVGRDQASPLAPLSNESACRARAQQVGGCIRWTANRRAFRILRAGETPKLAVPIRADGSSYARIAARGDKLLLFLPQLSPRFVGTATQCECDGMPRPASSMCSVDSIFFIVDDRASVEIEEVWVPLTEDRIDWVCKTTAV